MLLVLQIATTFLASVAFGLALAHALEKPGKMRLDEETYLAAQTIYYPGFTIGGASEPLAIVGSIALLLLTRPGTPAFWLTLTGMVSVLAMQLVFWVMTQPVNRYWLRTQQLKGIAAKFFSADMKLRPTDDAEEPRDWKVMRDRWEFSHFLRTILSGIALVSLLVAIAI
jgi:hypothetical protein